MIESITIKNNSQQSEFSMDKLTTPEYILEKVDFGEVPVNYITNKFIKQFGSTPSHRNVSERAIEIVGNIIADTPEEMTERKVFLNKFFNPLEDFTAIYKNYTIDFVLENSIKYTLEEQTNNEIVCNFKINAIAHYPLFSNTQSSEEVVAGFQPMFHFPLILYADLHNEVPPALQRQRGVVFGKKNLDTKTVIISNLGDVEVGAEITIKANGGTVVNPRINNISSGEYLQINKTLSDGEIIIINTTVGNKSIMGSTDGGQTFTNYFAYKSFDSNWLQIRSGSNSFDYEADSGENELEIEMKFNSSYVEVQECF